MLGNRQYELYDYEYKAERDEYEYKKRIKWLLIQIGIRWLGLIS